MTTQPFTRNYSDHSNDTGFQFEFFCDKCGNGHRSSFTRSNVGFAASLLKAAGSLFGGALYQAGRGADHLKDALRGPAWDSAYKDAVDECRSQFRQCTLCGKWVCPEVCWNHARGLCEECAPDLNEHAPAIQAQAAVEQARDKARQVDQMGELDLSRPLAAPGVTQCVKCRQSLAQGARFCASCGTQVPEPAAKPRFCTSCGQSVPMGARFCAGCGTPS
ncbi:MAG TPA: zinc ribbon domain-containing protein [Polyangiaceae bacterium]